MSKLENIQVQRRDVNLSFLSLECIVLHLDITKRLAVLLSYPRFQSWDCSAPLKIDKLVLSPSVIIIDDIVFKFGTVYNFEKDGESEWRSLEHDVLEPGDIILEKSPANSTDSTEGVPIFNKLTILKDSSNYVKLLPLGLSIRHAFKKLTSALFGNGRKIQVESFRFDGCGIVPLGVGIKFTCKNINLSTLNEANLVKAYNTVLRKVDQISTSVRWFASENCDLKSSMIQNCSKLEICPFDYNVTEEELTLMKNDVLYLGLENAPTIILPVDYCLQIIESWSKTENRKVGSKLFLAYRESHDSMHVIRAFLSREILQMGFERKERTRSLMPLKNGRTSVELILSNEKNDVFSKTFKRSISFHSFLCLEIVNSH